MTTLLDLHQVKQQLDGIVSRGAPDFEDLRIRGPGLSQQDRERIEQELRCELPPSYRNIASRIDFGRLTVGVVQFGAGRLPAAADLIEKNTTQVWWRESRDRPANYILIGGSDPFNILLRLDDGAIVAFDRELEWTTGNVVASDIEHFLRGLATAFLLRSNPPDVHALNASVGGEYPRFWHSALT